MQSNISFLITSQVSERLNAEYPLFVKFLTLYYEYAQARDKGVGSVLSRHLDFDIDNTLDVYVDEFYSTYGKYLPKETALDRREIIKLLNDLYVAKGTENSFRLLFRLLYNKDVTISKPSEQILRASDGRWYQEIFITAKTLYGDYTKLLGSEFEIENANGAFYIKPIRIETVGTDTHRIFFTSYVNVKTNVGDIFEIKENDSVVYKAQIESSVSDVRIVDGGLNFSVGQIFKLSGSVADTYFKIKSVSSVGKITSLEILNYGYNHTLNQQSYISPYTSVPPATGTSIYTEETPPGSGLYTHNVIISETIYTISEQVSGLGLGDDIDRYFLEDYTDIGDMYAAVLLFDNTFNTEVVTNVTNNIVSDITLQDYLDSRATISLVYNGITRMKGKFLTEDGQLSNEMIKLQDNYYYQLFSYVINSSMNNTEYHDVVYNILHPAGLKLFSAIEKNNDIDISSLVTVDAKYIYIVNVSDEMNTDDIIIKNASVEFSDNIIIDEHIGKTFNLPVVESGMTVSDNSTRLVNIGINEPITLTESLTKDIAIGIADSFENIYVLDYFAENFIQSATIVDSIDVVKF